MWSQKTQHSHSTFSAVKAHTAQSQHIQCSQSIAHTAQSQHIQCSQSKAHTAQSQHIHCSHSTHSIVIALISVTLLRYLRTTIAFLSLLLHNLKRKYQYLYHRKLCLHDLFRCFLQFFMQIFVFTCIIIRIFEVLVQKKIRGVFLNHFSLLT